MADSEPGPSTGFSLRAPSKYNPDKSKPSPTTTESPFVSPSVDWLSGTWCVTHSTLRMWRSARNVRISYKALPSSSSEIPPSVDDLVEYEKKSGSGGVKTVEGIDKPDSTNPGAWTWRGKGWLRFVTSHWEVIGWGESPLVGGDGVERWAVTWFAPTIFTKEGVDIYSDRKEGLSPKTVESIMAEFKKLNAPVLTQMVEKDMQDVEIKLPWKER